MKGLFISVEGADGTGKTTQANLLYEYYKSIGKDVMLTKEPGSIISKECQQIRKLLLSPENDLGARSEMMLFLSTCVYQGYGRGFISLGSQFTQMLSFAAHDLEPDFTFVLTMPVEKTLERARKSNKEFVGGDRMEREDIEFHKKLHDGFLEEAKKDKRRIVIDADRDVEKIHEEIVGILGEGFIK